MTKEPIKRKAKTYSKNYWYNTNNSVNVASIEKLLIDFATEVTKELQEENERLKEIKEDYYDFLQKKNEEDWKGDNVVGCLKLRIEQKDKQLIKAKELIELLLSDNRTMKAQFESEEQANIWFEHIHQAEQFLNSEVEK